MAKIKEEFEEFAICFCLFISAAFLTGDFFVFVGLMMAVMAIWLTISPYFL